MRVVQQRSGASVRGLGKCRGACAKRLLVLSTSFNNGAVGETHHQRVCVRMQLRSASLATAGMRKPSCQMAAISLVTTHRTVGCHRIQVGCCSPLGSGYLSLITRCILFRTAYQRRCCCSCSSVQHVIAPPRTHLNTNPCSPSTALGRFLGHSR